MKSFIKLILQKILGFDTYLFIFSRFIINRLEKDKNEKDFIFFLNMIPDNGIILDIGANIGIMTVHLARKFKNTHVYAFEPIPQNIRILHKIINHYKLNNVKIFEYALGDKSQPIEMIMPVVKSVKMQGLSHVVHESIKEFNEGIKINVESKRLDDIHEFNIDEKITAIKIDVENYEYFVLKGGEKLIKQNRPIIYCELWDNENRYKCFELLKSLGYKIQYLDNDSLIDIESKTTTKQNFFFIPNN